MTIGSLLNPAYALYNSSLLMIHENKLTGDLSLVIALRAPKPFLGIPLQQSLTTMEFLDLPLDAEVVTNSLFNIVEELLPGRLTAELKFLDVGGLAIDMTTRNFCITVNTTLATNALPWVFADLETGLVDTTLMTNSEDTTLEICYRPECA